MSGTTVRDCFDLLQEVISYYKNNPTQHEYTKRCIKQDIAFVNQVFNKLQMKIEEVRMNKQFQNYIEKLKPLLKAEQVQRNIFENKMKLHKASNCETVEAQKLSIQHICHQLGLKCVEGNDMKSYISFDANEFYLEISFTQPVDQTEKVRGKVEVILVNEGTPEDQPQIAEVIDKRDFTSFREHLLGFISIFNIPLESRVRPVLFAALRSLESDLVRMSGVGGGGGGDHTTVAPDFVNKSPVGHVICSRGGTGIKVIFFHCPAIITSSAPKSSSTAAVGTSSYGNSLRVGSPNNPSSASRLSASSPPPSLEPELESGTIGVECSNINQLPTQPLAISNADFKPISQINSEYVEATFVLKLARPLIIPVVKMNALLKKLGNNRLIKSECITTTYLDLIFSSLELKGDTKPKDRSLKHVKLNHVYYLPGENEEKAVLVHRLPFSHPSQVPIIITAVRQQMTYNRILLSCHQPGTYNGSQHKDNNVISPLDNTRPLGNINTRSLGNSSKTTDPHDNTTRQITVDITLQPGDTMEAVFAHPAEPRLCVLNVKVGPLSVTVNTCDTLKCALLGSVGTKYLSLPLTLHALLRILVHHHKHNIKPVKLKVEQAEPEMSNVYDFISSSSVLTKVSSPPEMSVPPSITPLCLDTASLKPEIDFPPEVTPMLTPPPMSQQPMPGMPGMSSPFGTDSHLGTLPSPPDIIAQKRKRPLVMADSDEALLKKPTKLVKICESSVPNIPVLSPMSSLSNIRHTMRPIGPPSLKPAPIHSSPPQGGMGTIPCLSPAPHMIRAPMGVPPLQGGSSLQGGSVPTLQSSVQSLQGNVPPMQISGVKNEMMELENECDGKDGVS